jgi:hypothetical protein
MAWERSKLHPGVGWWGHGNEHSDSKKYEEFPGQFNDCQLPHAIVSLQGTNTSQSTVRKELISAHNGPTERG